MCTHVRTGVRLATRLLSICDVFSHLLKNLLESHLTTLYFILQKIAQLVQSSVILIDAYVINMLSMCFGFCLISVIKQLCGWHDDELKMASCGKTPTHDMGQGAQWASCPISWWASCPNTLAMCYFFLLCSIELVRGTSHYNYVVGLLI